jgi:protein-disulfide isomerase
MTSRLIAYRPRKALIVTGLLFGLALLLAACSAPTGAPAPSPVATSGSQEVAVAPAAAVADDPRSKGAADAPLTIVEYSDYQCPYCARWVEQTYPTILQEYIDAGKARLLFRDFPLSFHQNADNAAVAARCAAEQGVYWEMHDRLFANQAQWSELADPSAIFGGYAEQLGIDPALFGECLSSGNFDQAIAEDTNAGIAAGVSGTPSFVINGQLLVGAQPVQQFRAALETVLAGGSIVEPTPVAAEPPKPVDIPIAGAPVKGNPDAPLTIVEYSDYQCPFCSRFTLQTLPGLLQEYVNSGKAKLVFKDFPLDSIHPQAHKAAEAARCVRELGGGDEAYWQMHDKLFQGQEQWAGQESASTIFAAYAEEIGVEQAAFQECLDSGKYTAAVSAEFEEGLGFGVQGTPTFFINGQIFVGAQPLQNFQQAIAVVESGGNIIPALEPTPTPVPTPSPLTQDVPLEDAAGIKGDPNAPVTIVEYSDYQCPFCQRHFAQVLPQLQQYIDEGKVKYVFKDFPLTQIHPQAPKAAEAARCAGDQEAYWEMHDKLFANQQAWSGQANAVDLFKGYAEELGLDAPAFAACLDGNKYQAVVEANLMEGVNFGVRGTPGFFINRIPLPGAYPLEAFQQLIEAESTQ